MLSIVLHPDKRLKQVCQPVPEEEFGTENLKDQVAQMIETMYAYAGIGLAANQVGYENRVLVVAKDPDKYPNTTPLVMINPVVRRSNKKQTMKEGCLSFPGVSKYRRRAKSVIVTYRDQEGGENRWKAERLAGQCIQHELDHLNGKTFLDK